MRGSLRERRPGNWELIVQLQRDASISRRKQLDRTHLATKRVAQRALAALVADVSAGNVSSSATTLHELLAQWLDVVEDQLSPTSVREYRRLVMKKIGPDLGQLRLRKVTTQRIDSYYSTLTHEGGPSPASVRHVHAVLRRARGQGVEWGRIPTNPAVGASPPKIRRNEINPPSVAVTRELLEAADQHDPEFGALLQVLTATGARRGEVRRLRWSDLDTGSRTLSIQRSVASVAGGTDREGHEDARGPADRPRRRHD